MSASAHTGKGVPAGRAARKRQTAAIDRNRVAERALSLITEGGIQAVTPHAVARLLRVPARRLARFYPTSTSILTALLDYIEERLLEHVRKAASGATAIDRLERLILLSCDDRQGHARLLSAAFAAALAVGRRHQAPRKRLVRVLMSYLKDVTNIVRDGQRLGQIRSDVDAGTVALMYLGLVQPAAILSHASAGDFDLRNHVKRSFTLFRDAIGM